jgi:undecaprenyl-diphosphatase
MNLEFRQRPLVPLITVTVAAMVFAVLLIAVRLQWAPLESADHGAAGDINRLVAGHAALVTVVKAVTWLGSNGVLWTVIGAATVILAIRRRWRLAIYLLVTGAGALVLDPILKSLVGRLRPVVAHPIAHGTGNSFPSGHSLGSLVCYGAILLVFLPAARGRWRTAFVTVIVTLVALIGISRILLGVHYLSDVLGAWAIGITWLAVTAFAFELTRSAAGQPVTDPVTEGLETEARADLEPAQPEAAAGRRSGRHYGRVAAAVVVAWVLILGIIVGLGELITKDGGGNVLGDRTIPRWFAAHRTAGLTHWSQIFSTLGATQAILIVGLATCVVFLAVTRHWRPVVVVATVMVGELGAFLAAAAVVRRPRPDVTHLDQHLPHLGLPIRARGRNLLSLRRHCDPGHRPRPRLVALAVPHPRDRHARPRRPIPHVPGRAPPDRYPRQPSVRGAVADRDGLADQAERGRPAWPARKDRRSAAHAPGADSVPGGGGPALDRPQAGYAHGTKAIQADEGTVPWNVQAQLSFPPARSTRPGSSSRCCPSRFPRSSATS